MLFVTAILLFLKCITFVLISFTFSLQVLHQEESSFNRHCKASSFSTIKTISSAYNKQFMSISPTLRAGKFDFRWPIMSFMKMLNSVGDSESPWSHHF